MSLSRELIVAAKARADAALHFDGHPDDWDDVAHSAVVDVPVMADALLRVLDRETVARAIRDRVRLGPIGPNSAAIIAAGGRVSLTASEADDAADAVLDVLYGGGGSSPNTERSSTDA